MVERAWNMPVISQGKKVAEVGVSSEVQQVQDDSEKKRIQRKMDEEEAEHEARMAKYRRQAEGSPGTGSGFEVKGGVNLGTWNPQAEAEKASERERAAREDLLKELALARQESSEAKGKLNEERLTNLAATMQKSFDQSLASLQAQILELNKSKAGEKTVLDQMNEMKAFATELGWVKQQVGQGGGSDGLQLQIAEMNINAARSQREFEWKMEQDKRNYDRELKKDEIDAQIRREELENKRKRDDMFAQAPELLGRAVGAAMRESPPAEGSEGPAVAARKPAAVASKKKSYHLEVPAGSGGEIECPECQQPIAIGPTADSAVCANCGKTLPIQRVGS